MWYNMISDTMRYDMIWSTVTWTRAVPLLIHESKTFNYHKNFARSTLFVSLPSQPAIYWSVSLLHPEGTGRSHRIPMFSFPLVYCWWQVWMSLFTTFIQTKSNEYILCRKPLAVHGRYKLRMGTGPRYIFCAEAFQALVKRWDKCINVAGEYVEK